MVTMVALEASIGSTMTRRLTALLLTALLLATQPTPRLVLANTIDLHAIEIVGSVDRSSLYALQDLARAYRIVNRELTVDVQQSLTADTINNMVSRAVDFGVVLSALPATSASAVPSLYMMPLILTALVPIYRLDALGTNAPLVLTRSVLTRIYCGQITWWNDTAIQATNPSVTMPGQPINVLIEAGTGGRNNLLKQGLSSFNSTVFAASGMKVSGANDYPTNKYAAFRSITSGVTNLASAVIAMDGSIAVAFHPIANSLGAKMASMINQAGTTVTVTADSLTFAAVELGTKPLTSRTSVANLIDATGTSAWPMPFFSYLLIDTMNSRGTCKARESLVQFFLYFYQNSIAASVLATRGYTPVPSIIRTQLGVIDLLNNQVMCRGAVALPTAVAKTRIIGVATQLLFQAQLLAAVYLDPQGDVLFTVQQSTDEVLATQLVSSEVDVALINPSNLDDATWQAVQDSDDYLILPLYSQALTLFANPQLTSTINIASETFILNTETVLKINTGCVLDYNSSALVKLNPWLPTYTKNASVPIHRVSGCSNAASKLAIYFSTLMYNLILKMAATGQLDSDVLACTSAAWNPNSPVYRAFFACTDLPSFNQQFVTDETIVPALVSGTLGGMGPMVRDGSTDKVFPLMPTTRNGVTTNTKSDLTGILSCAYDTFDAATLTFNLNNSNNATCWPFLQQTVAVVRKRYYSDSAVTNSSSCTRGLDALQFMSWLFTTDEIDALTDANNVARLAAVPGVQEAYISALNAVTCNGETLLITLPIEWSVNTGIQGFGYAAAAIGMALTVGLMIFTVIYHRHPVIRSSSPLFMLMSLVGVFILFLGAVSLIMNVTTQSCISFMWEINMGIMITFAPLFAKTWRIYRIFGRRKLSVVKISNRKLMALVVALLIIEAILMIVWHALSPIKPYTTSSMEGSPSRQHDYNQCGVEGTGKTMLIVAGVEKGLLLGFGALMAFSTRRVSGQFNESSQIALAIYNVVFSIGIIAPIIIIINATGDILVALLLFVLLWIAFFTACILVIPKMLHIMSPANGDAEMNTSVNKSVSSSNGFSFLSLDILDSLTVVNQYLAALKRHVEQVETKQTTMKMRNSNAIASTKGVTMPATVVAGREASLLETSVRPLPLSSMASPPHQYRQSRASDAANVPTMPARTSSQESALAESDSENENGDEQDHGDRPRVRRTQLQLQLKSPSQYVAKE